MLWDNTLIQLFAKGGFVMWPLLGCSVIGLAIIVERAFVFGRIRLHFLRFMEELLTLLRRGEKEGAQNFCRSSQHPVGHVARRYLENLSQPDALRNDILRREGSLQLARLEQRLRGLSVIAHLAPLLGLLGTVTGLVTAFRRIEQLAGVVQPSDLAGGIWEALMTTVFGLAIAIPCMAAYHMFEHRADKIARQMQFAISQLNEFFGKTNGHAAIKHETAKDEEVNAVR